MVERIKRFRQWIMILAAVFAFLTGMFLTIRVEASAEAAEPEEKFEFEVTVKEGSLDFYVPTSGRMNQGNRSDKENYGKSYQWRITWGDGTDGEYSKLDSPNAADAPGIKHEYEKADTYCITIEPYDSDGTDAWLAAFGFSDSGLGANKSNNRNKVVSVNSPLTSKMTRTQKQLNSGQAPSFEWAFTFYGCKNLTMGPNFNMPQDITIAGNNYADSMFFGCSGADFTIGSNFNMPQNLTEVGTRFAYCMFDACTGDSFTMSPKFNMPQRITTAGQYFAYKMFDNCYGNSFTMGEEFNMPQALTDAGDNFAQAMFNACRGNSFTMGSSFTMPQALEKAGRHFATGMFENCGGDSFTMGAAFTMPQEITEVDYNFAGKMFIGCSGTRFTMGTNFNMPQKLISEKGDFAKGMFQDCKGSSFNMSDNFNLPQQVTAVQFGFAYEMFEGCSGDSFTMGAKFNLPQNITTAESSFAYNMFYGCKGSSFTMGDKFNLPQKITIAEHYFAVGIFRGCKGDSFKMGAVFNLPENITKVGNNFASTLFSGCSGAGFEMGTVFNLPQNITEVGDGFANSLFSGCSGAGFTMSDTFNLPPKITKVGNDFARGMFSGCSGNSFTMGKVFNLPQDITEVGDYFACSMFTSCKGNSFTITANFNLPQKITTAGKFFANYMFENCTGNSFTMGAKFNLPQNLETVDEYFAYYLFKDAGNEAFQINDVFTFPATVDAELFGAFTRALELNSSTLMQKRMAKSIINGKAVSKEENKNTFCGGNGIFVDYSYLEEGWGGEGQPRPNQGIRVNWDSYSFKSLISGYKQGQQQDMVLYVYNFGTSDIQNLAVKLTNGSKFSIIAGTETKVPGEKAVEFRIRVHSALAVGLYEDSLSITAKNSEPITIPISCRVIQQPKIISDVQQPQRSEIPKGAPEPSLQVEVEAVKDGGTLTYQWYKNTKDSTTGGTAITGATDASYEPPTNSSGTAYYYVIITNKHEDISDYQVADVVSKTAKIEVFTPEAPETPVLTEPPADIEVPLAGKGTLSVAAQVTDGGRLSYQWYQNTQKDIDGGTAISGATKNSYTPATAQAGTYYYFVKVVNKNNNASVIQTAEVYSNPVTVTVLPKSLSEATVSITGTYTYTGSSILPDNNNVTVTVDGKSLSKDGSAYSYQVSNGINAGTVELTVTGIGNYTGEAVGNFTIEKAEIAIDTNASTVLEKTYTGTDEAELTSVAFTGLVNGETLVPNQDYTVSSARYNSAQVKEANTVTAVIVLKENGPLAKNYHLAQGNFQKSAVILPYSVDGVNRSIKIKEKTRNDYEYSLVQFLPLTVAAEQVSDYQAEIVDDSSEILTGVDVRVDDQKLILSAAEDAVAGEQATVKISFVSDNYTISDAELTVTVTDKTLISVSGVTVENRTYDGNAIEMTGTAEFTDTITKNPVELVPVYEWLGGAPPIDAGNYTLTVTAEAGEDYEITPLELPFTIYKAGQTITFADPQIRYVGQQTTLEATTDSGLPITYLSSDETKAVVNDGVLTLKEAGEVTITAEQVGDNNFNSAVSVSHTFTIQPPRSSDALLSSLSVNSGTLNPAFDPAVSKYTLTVSSKIANVVVSAVVKDEKAQVTGTGKQDIPVGISSLTITVTAEDGTQNSYVIDIKRLYTISYSLNGGKNDSKNPISYEDGTGVTLKAPTRTGYTFDGWYSNSSFKTKVTEITKGSTGDKTLYAKWTANTYKINFNAAGGTVKSSDKKVTYNATYGSLPVPKRAKYAFSGWYTKSSGGNKVTSTTKVTITGTQTLYARWSRVSVKKAVIKSAVNKSGKKALVTINKVTDATGYEVLYATNAKMTGAKKVTATKTTATLKGLKKGKTYYIKVRAYKKDSAGKLVYGADSKVKTVKINK